MMPSETIAFLRCVLPAEGSYCAVVFNPRPKQTFFDTIEGLAEFILRSDAAGKTAYHACATYKSAANRKQENAHAARSLWLDVDCDPSGLHNGRPCYRDKPEAAEAVVRFCHA